MQFTVEMEDNEALALAQFLKRLGWNEMRINAVDEEETYTMRTALGKVQDALADEGFNPR